MHPQGNIRDSYKLIVLLVVRVRNGVRILSLVGPSLSLEASPN